jgi:hypothetical protein
MLQCCILVKFREFPIAMRTRRVANARVFNLFAFGTYIAFVKCVMLIQEAHKVSKLTNLNEEKEDEIETITNRHILPGCGRHTLCIEQREG